jgi:hypothetical protein
MGGFDDELAVCEEGTDQVVLWLPLPGGACRPPMLQ